MGNHKDIIEEDDAEDFLEVIREIVPKSPLYMKVLIDQMKKVDPFVMPNISLKLQPPMGFIILRIAAKSSYGGKDGACKK